MRVNYELVISAIEQTVKDEFYLWFFIVNQQRTINDGKKCIQNFEKNKDLLCSILNRDITTKERADIYVLIHAIDGCIDHIKQVIQ